MRARRIGQRFPLVLYRRAMDRLWPVTAPLGLLMAAWWKWAGRGFFSPLNSPNDLLIFITALVVICFTIFALVARNMAYVQAREDHIRLATPFLRLKISYRRIKSIHPAQFGQLFPPKESNWAAKQFLEPFYSKTALAVEMNGYPLSKRMMRLFLGPNILLPTTEGIVILVENWMRLSNEIESLRSVWGQKKRDASRPRFGILSDLKK